MFLIERDTAFHVITAETRRPTVGGFVMSSAPKRRRLGGISMNKNTLRRVVAVPAALSIGLGSMLLATVPAHAIVIDGTTPAVDSASTPTPTPAATSLPSETPDATDAPEPSVPEIAPTSAPAPAPAPAPIATAPAVEPLAEAPVVTPLADAALPAPVLTSPAVGARLQGPSITVTGTGIPGNYVIPVAITPSQYDAITGTGSFVTDPSYPEAPMALATQVAADGTWSGTANAYADGPYLVGAMQYSADAEGTLTASSAFTPGIQVTITIARPPVPEITSPTAGTVVRSSSVTVTGTGDPGADVRLFLSSTSYFDQFVASGYRLPESDPEDSITEDTPGALTAAIVPDPLEQAATVDAAGTWSIVVPVQAGTYRVGAAQVRTDGTTFGSSALSETVDFEVAALPQTPAGNGTLPETGSDAGIIAGMGALLILGGGALLFARRSMTASTATSAE